MSTFYRRAKRCAMCWSKSEHTAIGSTNTFGSPDLDLRPPEMQRSTMYHWAEQCPKCGYTAYDIGRKVSVSRRWLKRPEYISCEGRSFKSDLAERFYKIYMIARKSGSAHDAFNALMNAAWACDDQRDEENATICRRLLLPYLEQEIAKNSQKAEIYTVVRADVLRRAGLFEQLIDEYIGKNFSDELLNSICRFQIEKAQQRDCGCYTVADVTSE